MIYVDEIREYPSGKWCHMWSDRSEVALDLFAASIGLKLAWAQRSNSPTLGSFYHYDLRPSKRKLALSYGAQSVSLKDYLTKVKAEKKVPDAR